MRAIAWSRAFLRAVDRSRSAVAARWGHRLRGSRTSCATAQGRPGFHHLSRRFDAAKPATFAAAWTTVIGIAGFLLTVDGSNGAAAAAPAPTPALVAVTDDAPTTLTDLLGQGCPNPFEAMVLSGGTQGPWELSLDDQDCADGTVRVASDHATVLLQFHR